MPRDLEKEITAIFHARTEQLPAWHEIMQMDGDEVVDVAQGLTLIYGLMHIHRDVSIRLAREIDDLARAQEA